MGILFHIFIKARGKYFYGVYCQLYGNGVHCLKIRWHLLNVLVL